MHVRQALGAWARAGAARRRGHQVEGQQAGQEPAGMFELGGVEGTGVHGGGPGRNGASRGTRLLDGVHLRTLRRQDWGRSVVLAPPVRVLVPLFALVLGQQLRVRLPLLRGLRVVLAEPAQEPLDRLQDPRVVRAAGDGPDHLPKEHQVALPPGRHGEDSADFAQDPVGGPPLGVLGRPPGVLGLQGAVPRRADVLAGPRGGVRWAAGQEAAEIGPDGPLHDMGHSGLCQGLHFVLVGEDPLDDGRPVPLVLGCGCNDEPGTWFVRIPVAQASKEPCGTGVFSVVPDFVKDH
mmetsp:Transcript_147231/g.257194  ORF Transcript_147231/g.257194 Transcript_147231/m.257194 type:complete len:292 (-) Transcript_147231:507-1382(-)